MNAITNLSKELLIIRMNIYYVDHLFDIKTGTEAIFSLITGTSLFIFLASSRLMVVDDSFILSLRLSR